MPLRTVDGVRRLFCLNACDTLIEPYPGPTMARTTIRGVPDFLLPSGDALRAEPGRILLRGLPLALYHCRVCGYVELYVLKEIMRETEYTEGKIADGRDATTDTG